MRQVEQHELRAYNGISAPRYGCQRTNSAYNSERTVVRAGVCPLWFMKLGRLSISCKPCCAKKRARHKSGAKILWTRAIVEWGGSALAFYGGVSAYFVFGRPRDDEIGSAVCRSFVLSRKHVEFYALQSSSRVERTRPNLENIYYHNTLYVLACVSVLVVALVR